MERIASNIQVLLQAAEYLDRREREAEHGYASLLPYGGQTPLRSSRRPKPPKPMKSLRSVHNELEKHSDSTVAIEKLTSRREKHTSLPPSVDIQRHTTVEPGVRRRAQLRQCLEQLKQQVPMNADCSRYTTLSLLHRARLHIKKLEEQEQRAQQLKEQLQCEQQNLHQRLEELLGHSNVERLRADSLDSSWLFSERSDSDQEDAEVDVESLTFNSIEDDVVFSTGQEHSYSNTSNFWL